MRVILMMKAWIIRIIMILLFVILSRIALTMKSGTS